MLLKSNISKILIHSDEWFNARLAKFTSSEFHFLMDKEGIGKGGMTYIYDKVGEELTGIPCRKEINTESTEHGHEYEPENLRRFGQKKGIEFLVTQTLILNPNGREGSTPDSLIPVRESADKTMWQVETVEAKCPTRYANYIRLWNCLQPEDVKKIKKEYYWQVLHQMRLADALVGYLSIFNPFFKSGQGSVVEFKKIDLINEFKLMESRSQEAIGIFTEQRNKMILS